MTIKLTPKTKSILLLSFIAVLILGSIYFIYLLAKLPTSLDKDLTKLGKAGEKVKEDYFQTETLNITQTESNYQIKDFMVNGPIVKLAGQDESITNKEMQIEFPKDYQQPINIKLDEQRVITIADKNSKNYTDKTLVKESQTILDEINNKNPEDRYLKYESNRKSIYYAYQRNEQERELKNWIIYNKKDKNQEEQEEYQINNAKIKLNEQGEIEVFYFTDQDIQNQETIQNVDSNLLERAQRTLMKESGEDILNNNKTPDFIIPKPYYINNQEEKVDLNWEIDQETNTIKLKFNPKEEEYPVAVDPTFQFVAPGLSESGTVISANTNTYFGRALASGDLNGDGKDDLVVGNSEYLSQTGRVYIFYNDGSYHASAGGADVIINGEITSSSFGCSVGTSDLNGDGKIDLVVGAENAYSGAGGLYVFFNDNSYSSIASNADILLIGESGVRFGYSFTTGDFDYDGDMDLVVGGYNYTTQTGRTYVIYNDGSWPRYASGADIIITGEATSNRFGQTIISGDFNYDSRIDFAVSAYGYSSNLGRVYIFYNDGSYSTTASGADVIISGDATNNYFGYGMTSGDINYDGRTDLIASSLYSSSTGRAYIFYNDGTIPTTAATADVIITGEASGNNFGLIMNCGDLNNDGRTDLVVGSYSYSSSAGRAYVFYNDGTIPTTAATADVIITGETSSSFGSSLNVSDLDDDGDNDLVVGGPVYSSNNGRAYIFYNDGTIPTTAATADWIISGNTTSTGINFGYSMLSGDFNVDGKTDLIISEYTYNSNSGRILIFYGFTGMMRSEESGADVIITGEATNNYFGYSLSKGDFNGDYKTDIIVGAYGYNSNTGRAYVFYVDGTNNYGTAVCSGGQPSCSATNADIVVTGQASSSYFGRTVGGGDFNADFKDDIVVGADGYWSNYGRLYVFYTDGTIPTADTADFKILGESSAVSFGSSLAVGDLSGDSKPEIVVGASAYSTNTGRVYIFNNDGNIPELAQNADNIIIGEMNNSYFGSVIKIGNLNDDNKNDLAIGAWGYDSNRGRVYVFYQDGSFPSVAGYADTVFNGEVGTSRFGYSLDIFDFGSSGKDDLAVGGYYSDIFLSDAGAVFIFYNDGSYPNYANDADVVIGGDTATGYFGASLAGGDFNADGKVDLAVGTPTYSTNTGRVHIFYSDKLQIDQTGLIINEGNNREMGYSLASGDFNNDSKSDLIVGSSTYSSTGRVYIFYNDGNIPSSADLADKTITGDLDGNFGNKIKAEDISGDGKPDLIVGNTNCNAGAGRVYVFYNDGDIPENANRAELIFNGEAGSFGADFSVGDFDYDGKNDIAIGACTYSANNGRVYIFYNDGMMPSSAASADVIISGETYSYFGAAMTSGDFNYDGRIDLAVGAYYYAANLIGRAYIFYNDGSITISAGSADVAINGEGINNAFGNALVGGDFNYDGRTDLAVGACINTSQYGRAYIFYNDGAYPASAVSADIIITGEATAGYFGHSLTSGDFNYDGRIDLAISADFYNTNLGRIYIFYNDGSIPTTAATADVIIAGEASNNYFGSVMVSGDFNNDGRTDLAAGAYGYSTSLGRVYVFYNDGTIPTTAATADVIITGESNLSPVSNYFGQAMASGDLNQDGLIDLVVGAYGYNTNYGRAYIFYNKSNFGVDTDNADVIIEGESGGSLGYSFSIGDMSNDNINDLTVGSYSYSSNAGRVYIFNGDGTNNFGTVACAGSNPTICQASNADKIISGEASSQFGITMSKIDFNGDGKNDLAVGASAYSSNAGRVYIFYNDGTVPSTAASADFTITGESSSYFGSALSGSDLDANGREDLIVGGYGYSSSTGRVYLFYGDFSIPTTAATADVIISGESSSNYFGIAFTNLDLNSDNKSDLIVGANGANGSLGRVYVFYGDGTNNYGNTTCSGSAPTTCASANADIVINSKAGFNGLGRSFAKGDFNKDSKDDLIVGSTGLRVYAFYNDGSISTSVLGADIEIGSDSSTTTFGYSMATGNFNNDTLNDLVAGAYGYNSSQGRVYLFNLTKEDYGMNFKMEGNTGLNGRAKLR